MTTITWTISQLDRSLPDGTVLIAHWRCEGNDAEFSGSVYGTQSFPAKDPSDASFVPYEEITEELALTWLHEAMQEDQVRAHEDNVKNQIAKQKNPETASGLPWA